MTETVLTFEDLGTGTLVDNQYQSNGVTIGTTNPHTPAMIFDTANPTGGDWDLASDTAGNVLILSEDGDSSDPDDNAGGGTFTFDFEDEVTVNSLYVLDMEEGGWIRLYDEHGDLIDTIWFQTADGEGADIPIGVDGVAYMEVELCGSGAIDNLSFTCPPQVGDGTVEGTCEDDLIDLNYTGDPEGDVVDGGDAILPGAGPNDDLILGFDGNDTIRAGEGDDTVYGGEGDDDIDGGTGNDTLYGDGGAVCDPGGDFFEDRAQDISNVVFYFDTDGDGLIDYSVKVDEFPDGGDESFISNDLDDYFDQLLAFVIEENPELSDADIIAGVSVKGGTEPTQFYAVSGNENGPLPDEGPTMNTGPGPDQVLLYEDFFDDYDPSAGGGGTGGGDPTWNDTIAGGEGHDTIYGMQGDDLIITDDGGDDEAFGGDDRDTFIADAGDVIDGGAGGDDFDTLDLSGKGPFTLADLTPDSNGNGFDGTVVFVDGDGVPTGETIEFTEIERIVGELVNGAPTAEDDTAETDEDTPVVIDVLGNDSDPNGDPLEVISASSPDGDVTINPGGTLTFTPDENFNGETTISYTISDGNGGTDDATVTVTVNPVNDDPDAVDDNASTAFNTPVIIDVLDNDSDVDGDPLDVVSATSPDGDVVINPDGTVTFTPDPGFTGDTTIEYTISDGNGGSDSATVAVTVGAPPLDGTVEGTAGDDLIDGGYLGDPEGDRVDNNDAILPGDVGDQDLIYGFEGDDTILAGQDDDEVYGGTGNDTILGQDGNDTLYGEDGNDTISGGKDNDTIYGGADDDILDGKSGDDLIEGGTGNDTIIGGGGNDSLFGEEGDDSITGDNNIDYIDGGTGDDDIDAGASDDTVFGGDGSDTVLGGAGNDYIDTSGGVDPLPDVGYPGFYPADSDPNDDKDTVDGGTGNDTIITGDDDDIITGGDGDDVIDAGFDDDQVDGGAGNDTIIGSEGNDTIFAGDGDDVVWGGITTDILDIADDDGDLVTFNNNDTIDGGAGNDTLYGNDDDDIITGGTGNDFIDGGVDDDDLSGEEGDDTILGGQGDDTVSGGAGQDTITGGDGADQLFGNEDEDTFFGGTTGDFVDGGSGFTTGIDFDTLDLTGSDVDFITYTSADREDGIVTFTDGTTMTFEEIENVIPCFTPGTRIATPRGEVAVEDLREGDRVITRDNGLQEIRWVGQKPMTGIDLARSRHLRPILVKAGALGNGLPERDMMVSPNHRLLVSNDMTQLYFEETEVLAAAKHLCGIPGIQQVDAIGVTYIHFMFDRHEVVLSDGAWTESFQPGDYSLKGLGNAQRLELFELFPELKTRTGRDGYVAARKSLKKHEARLLRG